MGLRMVPTGKNPPDDVNVIIKIPAHSDPVKYEVDKDCSAVFVDRFMSTTMFYPCRLVTSRTRCPRTVTRSMCSCTPPTP